MTDDLVKRLRGYPGPRGFEVPFHVTMKEAADRIEALEAALRKIADVKDGNIWGPEDVWACLDRCVAVADTALGEKKDD